MRHTGTHKYKDTGRDKETQKYTERYIDTDTQRCKTETQTDTRQCTFTHDKQTARQTYRQRQLHDDTKIERLNKLGLIIVF